MAPLKFTTVKPSRVGHLSQLEKELSFDLANQGKFTLPLSSIRTITLDRALLFGGATVTIRLRDATLLPELKRLNGAVIELKVKKANVDKADELVKSVTFELMENSVDDLLDFMDENT